MSQHERGLYETLITEALDAQLGALGDRLEARRSPLHEAEAADRIGLHLARVVERAVPARSLRELLRASVSRSRREIAA